MSPGGGAHALPRMRVMPAPVVSSTAAERLLALEIAAHRASQIRSVALGTSHALANALQALSGPGRSEERDRAARAHLAAASRVLSAMGRSPEDGFAPTLVEDVLEEVDEWQRFQAALPPAAVAIECPPGLPAVRARRGSLHQALLAVVTNVKEALAGPAGAEIRIVAGAESGLVRLRFERTGSAPVPEGPMGRNAAGPPIGDRATAAPGLLVARHLIERDGGRLGAERNPSDTGIVVELAAWTSARR